MLVISFAIWGISGRMIGGFGSASHVIAAGGTTVSLNEYRLAYDRQLQIMSQQFGTALTREQAAAFGVDQQVLAQLVAGAVLDEQARKLGLGVSKDRIAQLAREEPAFKGPDGKFDRQQFEQALRQVGMTARGLSEQPQAGRRPPADRRGDLGRAAGARRFPRGGRALSRRGPHRRLRDDAALARRADRRARRIGAQDMVRGAQGDIRGARNTARSPTSSSIRRRIADPSSISDEQVKKDYEAHSRPLHDAGDAQDRAAGLPDADAAKTAFDSTQTGATFEDLVKAEGKTMADVQLGTLRQGAGPRSGDRRGGLRAERQRDQPVGYRLVRHRCCCASPK